MEDVSLKSAILARRKVGSRPWFLTYRVHDNIAEEDDHWHEESIILGDGALTSCSVVSREPLARLGLLKSAWQPKAANRA
jgi:hypothetical protein